MTFNVDGEPAIEEEFSRQDHKPYRFPVNRSWQAGEHRLEVVLLPLTPDKPQTRSLKLTVTSVMVRGPLNREHWLHPRNYEKYFTRDEPPEDPARPT